MDASRKGSKGAAPLADSLADPLAEPLASFMAREKSGAWLIKVWASPGAKKNALAGLRQDRLIVKIAAPAVDGKANAALTAYLARLLGVPASAVSVAAGLTGRRKMLRVEPDNAPALGALVVPGQ